MKPTAWMMDVGACVGAVIVALGLEFVLRVAAPANAAEPDPERTRAQNACTLFGVVGGAEVWACEGAGWRCAVGTAEDRVALSCVPVPPLGRSAAGSAAPGSKVVR